MRRRVYHRVQRQDDLLVDLFEAHVRIPAEPAALGGGKEQLMEVWLRVLPERVSADLKTKLN